MHLVANLCETRVFLLLFSCTHIPCPTVPFFLSQFSYFTSWSIIVKWYHRIAKQSSLICWTAKQNDNSIPYVVISLYIFEIVFCIASTRNRYCNLPLSSLLINSYYRIKVHLINMQSIGEYPYFYLSRQPCKIIFWMITSVYKILYIKVGTFFAWRRTFNRNCLIVFHELLQNPLWCFILFCFLTSKRINYRILLHFITNSTT